MNDLRVTDVVSLREIEKEYCDELTALVLDNLEHLKRWLPWATEEYSSKNTNEFVSRSLAESREGTSKTFAIFRNDSIIGTIGANRIDRANKWAEIGYWISQPYEGQGIMTSSCNELIRHLFEELKLNRIVIKCATENFKSQAIPRRLGFTEEGISRQVEWLHDRFVGLVVFSLLREEWEND